jgi:hypothetical protein
MGEPDRIGRGLQGGIVREAGVDESALVDGSTIEPSSPASP